MKRVVVTGAGMVGICCALELSKAGFDVTLIDRASPGSGASMGNAGVISNNGIAPYPGPGLWKQILRLGSNSDPRVQFHWPHFFQLLPNLLRFLGKCNDQAFQHGISSLSYLTRDAVQLHYNLMKEAKADHLFNDSGWLRLYRTEGLFNDSSKERKNYDKHDVKYAVLSGNDIRELEPDISRKYHKAIWLTHTPSVRNPEKLCTAYFDLFRRLGGSFRKQHVKQLKQTRNGWEITTDGENIHTDNVVVCAGANSNVLLSSIGINKPLFIERGYHLAYRPEAGKILTRSIIDIELGVVFTPMDMGIRVTSSVNIVAKETSPYFQQMLRLIPQIENIFPMQNRLSDTPWMGHRPTTPDSLPIIGPEEKYPGLWLAFGHQHLGLTLGPKTGKLIATQMLGKNTDPESNAFLPNRF